MPVGDRALSPVGTRSAHDTGTAKTRSGDLLHYGVPSTIRMNPYVRCVHAHVDTIPEVRSLSELLAAPNHIAAAEKDTPCLRPTSAPSPVARTFAAGGVSATSPRQRCSPDVTEASLHDSVTHSGKRTPAASASPPLHFTHEGVATPNSFASVRKLERWLREQQAAHAAKSEAPRVVMGRGARGPSADEPPVMDPLAMCLPTSTGDLDNDKVDTDAADVHTPRCASGGAVDHIHLPRTDIEETLPNNRIVSPRSSTRVEAPTGASDDSAPSCAATGAARGAHSPQQRAPPHGFPPVPHPAGLSSARTMEGSPYHYLMRNYVGGTFLYYAQPESKKYFLDLCYRIVDQVRPILEQETLFPQCGLFPRLSAPAFVLGDIHGNFDDLSFFLQRLLVFHDFNLTPSNLLCLGDYVDRGPFSLECVMLLLSLKIMNSSKIVMLRGNHEDRVVCGDLQTYGRGCFLAQCHAVFGYEEGMRLFRAVTSLFRYLPLAAELVIPSAPNASYLRARSDFASFNVYGTETSRGVPIHGTPALLSPTCSTHSPALSAFNAHVNSHTGGLTSVPMKMPGGLEASAVGTDSAQGSHRCSSTPLPASDGGDVNPYSTILVANTSLGQPTREEAHEERILCTHGGIPRFFGPPREDGALDFLRSLRFPRLLTLFPNNPLATADDECAPEYYLQTLLPRLAEQYPQLARAALSEMEDGITTSTTTATSNGESPSSTVEAAHPLQCTEEAKTLLKPQPTEPSPSQPNTIASLLARIPYSDDDLRRAWFIMFDLMWSDPTPTEPESGTAPPLPGQHEGSSASTTRVNEWGFGINTRGSHVVSFTARAVDRFLTDYNYAMLFRAHQEKTHGLRWCKSNKVLTVFSSSNYLGHGNGAGCVVVSVNGEVQMIEKVGTLLYQ